MNTVQRAAESSSIPDIPDISGKALTVNGTIEPDQLGTTIVHEHLFIDFWRDKVPIYRLDAFQEGAGQLHWR